MRHAFRLGPVEGNGGRVHLYFAASRRGISPPSIATTDRGGLSALIPRAGTTALTCEPLLAHAGRRLGLPSAPLPAWLLPGRAALALQISIGESLDEAVDSGALLDFAQAAATFHRAAPWVHWHPQQVVRASVTGSRTRGAELSILGSGGGGPGLMLYDQPGTMAKVDRLVRAGRMLEAAVVSSLAVILDGDPSFVSEALEQALGLAAVPVPMRVRQGGVAPVGAIELAVLAAALRAGAALSPAERRAEGRTSRARVRLVAPVPFRRSRSKAKRRR